MHRIPSSRSMATTRAARVLRHPPRPNSRWPVAVGVVDTTLRPLGTLSTHRPLSSSHTTTFRQLNFHCNNHLRNAFFGNHRDISTPNILLSANCASNIKIDDIHRKFSTNNTNDNNTNTTTKPKLSLFQKIRKRIRILFGSNDDTPRAIQERRDIYWIILSVAHRKLRLEHQRELWKELNRDLELESDDSRQSTQGDGVDDVGSSSSSPPPSRPSSSWQWQHVTQEINDELTNQAASTLDESSDNLSEMSLTRLRREMQKYLEPQIVDLLDVACLVEGEMIARHEGIHDVSNDNVTGKDGDQGEGCDEGDDEDEYVFNAKEVEEYKVILLQEYEDVCKSLKDWEDKEDERNAGRSVPFLTMKKDAIATLLTYFRWWPDTHDGSESGKLSNKDDGLDSDIDEFGFNPSQADPDIVPAMRYYHVRNLVRSYYVRNPPSSSMNDDNNDTPNKDIKNNDLQQPRYYHSLLTLKSTIPNAGRGVYIDGFAPAGTLLAFFPGKVWPKEHLAAASLQTQMQFSDNDPRHQLSMRYDDIMIDARKAPYTVVDNLWAVAHIVNHPPPPPPLPPSEPSPMPGILKSTKNESSDNSKKYDQDHAGDSESSSLANAHHRDIGPNCVTVPINFTKRMLQEHPNQNLRGYIPNEYEKPPQQWAKNMFDEKVVMHGMGLVCSKDVKDEELFYDYRLSPDLESPNPYPLWYYVWDVEAAKNRWQVDDD